MDARAKSFMLLPEFHYPPGQKIALGRILGLNDDTKLPDPDEPLSIWMTVAEERITKQSIQPFEFDGDTQTTTSGNVDVDVSFFTGIGAGLKFDNARWSGLKIGSDLVVRTKFTPTTEEMVVLLSNSVISNTLKLMSRPSLYLITGLMVAHGAKIEDKTGRSHGGEAHANADLTSFQAPLNLGVGGGSTNTIKEGSMVTIKDEFVLAYQLVRMKKKLIGHSHYQVERKWALFDDTDVGNVLLSLDDYDLDYVGVDEEDDIATLVESRDLR